MLMYFHPGCHVYCQVMSDWLHMSAVTICDIRRQVESSTSSGAAPSSHSAGAETAAQLAQTALQVGS